jgi:hypothetical protein
MELRFAPATGIRLPATIEVLNLDTFASFLLGAYSFFWRIPCVVSFTGGACLLEKNEDRFPELP